LQQRIQQGANHELHKSLSRREDIVKRELGLVSTREAAAATPSELFTSLHYAPGRFARHLNLPAGGGLQGAAERLGQRDAACMREERLALGETLANPDWEVNHPNRRDCRYTVTLLLLCVEHPSSAPVLKR